MILFHAGLISTGLVGVDVVFVMCSFLTTSLLPKDRDTWRFSITRFHECRAR